MEEIATVSLSIDGMRVQAREGTTILEAARQNGIRIPTLCHHPALSGWGGCRICVVEVDKAPRLVASCVMPVREGMEVVTSSERILDSRRTILEFLFAERNHYCMFCAQSGDCELQSLAYELGMDHLTVPPSFREFPVDATNPYMALDHNRCILCGRCVRACKELAGNSVLNYQNRGARTLICKDLNESTHESSCDASGVCLQVCPTGAIFHRLRPHQAVLGKKGPVRLVQSRCPLCGLLCQTQCSVRDESLIRIDGLLSTDRPDRGQLCRKGRFEPLEDKTGRILEPVVRNGDGSFRPTTWEDALERAAAGLVGGKGRRAGLLGLLSSGCSSEEMFLLGELIKGAMGGHVGLLERGLLSPLIQAWREMDRTFMGLRECSWADISRADLILLVGADPERSQPLMGSLIRRAAMERKAIIGSIGPEPVLPFCKPLHVQVREDQVPQAIKALLAMATKAAGSSDPMTRWRKILSEVDGVEGGRLLAGLPEGGKEGMERLAQGFMEASSPIILAGQELLRPGGHLAILHLMFLALLKGLLPHSALRLVALKPGGNAAAAIRLGCVEIPGEMESQGAGACLLLVDGEGSAAGVGGVSDTDFLVLVGSHISGELMKRAHVILPRPLWTEQGGTYLSLDGHEAGNVAPVLSPPVGVRCSWETLLALAGRMGLRGLPGELELLRARAMAAMNLS